MLRAGVGFNDMTALATGWRGVGMVTVSVVSLLDTELWGGMAVTEPQDRSMKCLARGVEAAKGVLHTISDARWKHLRPAVGLFCVALFFFSCAVTCRQIPKFDALESLNFPKRALTFVNMP